MEVHCALFCLLGLAIGFTTAYFSLKVMLAREINKERKTVEVRYSMSPEEHRMFCVARNAVGHWQHVARTYHEALVKAGIEVPEFTHAVEDRLKEDVG